MSSSANLLQINDQMLNRQKEVILTHSKMMSQPLKNEKMGCSEHVNRGTMYVQAQRNGLTVFECQLHCDQAMAYYLQIYDEFKQKVGKTFFEQSRWVSKPTALINCYMQIQSNGMIALSSQQNSCRSSNYRVRFANIIRGQKYMVVGLVTFPKGYEIKLNMKLINYYCLILELNKNKIKFYAEPTIQIKSAWLMMEKQLNHEVQWFAPCSFNGEQSCFVARMNYHFQVYKFEIQRTNFRFLHHFLGNEGLRTKEDRQWYFVGENWIAFSNASDRELFKIYYIAINNEKKSLAQTEEKANKSIEKSGEKDLTTVNRQKEQIEKTNEVGSQSTINKMIQEENCLKKQQGLVSKKLQFSDQKQKGDSVHKSQKKADTSEKKINKDNEVMQDEDQDRIIVDEKDFDDGGNNDVKLEDQQMEIQIPQIEVKQQEQCQDIEESEKRQPRIELIQHKIALEQPIIDEDINQRKKQASKGKLSQTKKDRSKPKCKEQYKQPKQKAKKNEEKQNCSKAANIQDDNQNEEEHPEIEMQDEEWELAKNYRNRGKKINYNDNEVMQQQDQEQVDKNHHYNLRLHDKSKPIKGQITQPKAIKPKTHRQQQQVQQEVANQSEPKKKGTKQVKSLYFLRNHPADAQLIEEEDQVEEEIFLYKANKGKQSLTSSYWLRHSPLDQPNNPNEQLFKSEQKRHKKQQKLQKHQKLYNLRQGKVKGMTTRHNQLRNEMIIQAEEQVQQSRVYDITIKVDQKSIASNKKVEGKQFIDVLQVSNQKFAIINANHQLMICKPEISYRCDQYSTNLHWMKQNLYPVKLFSSTNSQRLNYLESSTCSIFAFDFNKDKHMPVVQRASFLSNEQIKDIKQVGHYEFIALTGNRIKFVDSRERGLLSRNDLSYLTQKNRFYKIALQNSYTAVVSQTDGIIKMFDLRADHLRALNRFELLSNSNKIQVAKTVNDELKIVETSGDIFCTYNNSSYLISSQSLNHDLSVFNKNIKISQRQVNEFNLSKAHRSEGLHVQSSFYDINRSGDTIIHIQKNRFQSFDVYRGEVSCISNNAGNVGYFRFDMFGGDELNCCYVEEDKYVFKKLIIN